ncbi:cytochrome b-c1 complex subunit 9 [Microplitis mediator]|uniref:cytochrome b-c1 complex subunit 9 n=1 Tax=Microplitis mediator TaxID=375433 RepID=UPI00255717B7|nr:cytochrome b-c1 complex subunit 9 [Microplitis mediator]
MSFQTTVYNLFFKRTSTFVVTAIAATFIFERAVTVGAEALFQSHNKGKLWRDIKHKYEK